jgi:ribosome biogenesis GTPase
MRKNIRTGTIIGHYGVAVEVHFANDDTRQMLRVKRNSGHVVGDAVEVEGEILTRRERESELSRMDARGGLHIVGANLDVLCIVVTCEPLPPPGFIDRAIISARATGLIPLLIMNKSDLDCFREYHASIAPLYLNSLDIFVISAEMQDGFPELRNYFSNGHRAVFVGPTGVGKSSILNVLLPHINLQTGEISESKKRGRHTTTVSTLHFLPDGGELIDSPGFNDFGLVDITVQQLASHFPGFEEAGEQCCRFRDCRHRNEPGCTILAHIEDGRISRDRYATYLQLLTEVEALESEPRYRERRHRRKK